MKLAFTCLPPHREWLAGKHRFFMGILVGCVLAGGGPGPELRAAPDFQAGVARVDITPSRLPIRTAGNLTLTQVSNVHDRLHVRALALHDGTNTLVLGMVDSCMMAREDLDRAKAAASRITGIPVENMLISSTHTHTAPAVYGCHGNDPEPEYREWLVPKITESVVQAWKNRQPARAGWAKKDLPTFVHCRRWLMAPGAALHPNPEFTGCPTNTAMMNPGYANTNKIRPTGPVDPAVTVLSIQTRDGRPLSVLANYSTHYASAPSDQISADYFGAFCEQLAEALQTKERNPAFVALMCNGTSGDANCIDATQPGWTVTPRRVAESVTQTVLEALVAMPYRDWVPLAASQEELQLAVRLPAPAQVEQARAYLATQVGNRPTRTWEENYARETVLLSTWPDRKQLLLQAMRIGDLGIGAIPCETYGSTGLALKRSSPFALTLIVGLANGYNGYLPPPDQFPLGEYTTWRARTSYLETNAEPKIQRLLTRLLQQTHASSRPLAP
jgi:hypothetical protein